MSKRSVIENVYKMPYRSAQRKIRIAKYIDKYPEMNQMTQREAERYLTKKIGCDKSDHKRIRKIQKETRFNESGHRSASPFGLQAVQ
jgi:hypothetical protein